MKVPGMRDHPSNEVHFNYPVLPARHALGDEEMTAAALRQFTLHRLLAYGVEAGDGLRLLEMAAAGQDWTLSAIALAEQLMEPPRHGRLQASAHGQSQLLVRASALLRISQSLGLDNSAERRGCYLRAADFFQRARASSVRHQKLDIPIDNGRLSGWRIAPEGPSSGPLVLVHGGVEGWSMDWEGLALAIAAEGMTAIVVDGPGQGETRFRHGTYLQPNWLQQYGGLCSFLRLEANGRPIGAVGNSLGAVLLLHVVNQYPIFDAVCLNGPLVSLRPQLSSASYRKKLGTFCTPGASEEEVCDIFSSMDVLTKPIALNSALLLLQGGADPMVSMDEGRAIFRHIQANEAQMVTFEGGEHVINRYPADKHHVLGSWLAQILKAHAESSTAVTKNCQF